MRLDQFIRPHNGNIHKWANIFTWHVFIYKLRHGVWYIYDCNTEIDYADSISIGKSSTATTGPLILENKFHIHTMGLLMQMWSFEKNYINQVFTCILDQLVIIKHRVRDNWDLTDCPWVTAF